jgi:serpin B
MNAFTIATYQQLARGEGNLILSPLNIGTALSMALAGAGGRTAEEIQAVLHLQHDAAYDAALGALASELAKAGNAEGSELAMANGLWVQKGFDIRQTFTDALANNYHAPLVTLDFRGNPEGARSEINRWTEERTKQRIKDLFPAGSLNAQTRLVLTSAIYFYGKWQDPFVSSHTAPAPFTLPGGGTTQTDFMNQTSHFGYAETPSAQILEMRYAGTGFAFDVVLPRKAGGLAEIEKSLTPANLSAWFSSLGARNVQVSLPKFRSESEFSLRKTLSTLGMPTAFTDQADFSGISPKAGLAISEVVHKAFVDVSEKGTEAAAATGIAMRATAMRMPETPVVFRADHPFLYMIRDTRSGAVLFIGRLMNPR